MSLFSIFSNKDAEDAAAARTSGYQQGYDQLSSLYGQGRDATTSAYGKGFSGYAPVTAQANAGYQAYGDATGANGTAGNARALSNFQTGPGYNFQLGQGLQAIDRGAASKGMVSGGGTAAAEQAYGTGLANQSWNQYVTNLAPFGNQAVTGAYGQGTLSAGLGNQLGASYQGQGAAANAAQQGIGNANAAADLNNYNVSQNGINAIMSGVKLGSSLLGFL